jgi:toxin FitB
MIVLDTNVISELMKLEPEIKVYKWVNKHPSHLLFTTAITAAELRSGFEQMPEGKKRTELGVKIDLMLEHGFQGRVLPFDVSCALHFARIFALRRAMGRRIEEPDAMIAATCSRHRFKVATRDAGGFSDCGIEVINPWTD